MNALDIDDEIVSRQLTVNSSLWYAQIFQAKSNALPKVYFLAELPTTDPDGNAIADADNLSIEIWSVDVNSGAGEQYNLSSLISSVYTGPYDRLDQYESGENPQANTYWHILDLSFAPLTLVSGSYYAIVFKSVYDVSMYYALQYRQDVFPVLTASDDEGTTWANNLVPTVYSGKTKAGAISIAILGNEVDDTTSFDSGDIIIGGTSSSSRGYPVYLYVENDSVLTTTNIALDFSLIPPASEADGDGEETDQAMMRWYYYKPATLPKISNQTLYSTYGAKPILGSSASFILFFQPDRLPPYPKTYFPSQDITVQSNTIQINPIYIFSPKNANHRISANKETIKNVTNKYSPTDWSHFMEKLQVEYDTDGIKRDVSKSNNPSYIDFNLEQSNEEIKEIADITLSAADALMIRGFSNIAKYKNYYIAFPKYETYSNAVGGNNWWDNNPTGKTGDSKPYKVYVSHKDTITTWQYVNLEFTDGTDGNDLRHDIAGKESRIIGIHDVFVTNFGSSTETETIFILLQLAPYYADMNPHLAIAYFQGAVVAETTLTFTTIQIDNLDDYDAAWTPEYLPSYNVGTFAVASFADQVIEFPKISSDYKGAQFIAPNNGQYLYFTARNAKAEYSTSCTDSKFGLWRIDLLVSSIADSITMIGTSNYVSAFGLSNRGFDGDLSRELEISSIYYDGDITYLGTCNYGVSPSNVVSIGTTERMGQVYKTIDFNHFNVVLSGDIVQQDNSQDWLQAWYQYSYTDMLVFADTVDGTNYSYAYDHIVNDKVAFMTKVGDLLHVWLSPSVHNMKNTPFHVATNLSTLESKLLRKFPITNFTEDNYFVMGSIATTNYIENAHLHTRSKYLRTIDGGAVSGHSIFICGREGCGEQVASYTGCSISQTADNTFRTINTGANNPIVDGVTNGLPYEYGGYAYYEPPSWVYITAATPSTWVDGPHRVLIVTANSIMYEVCSIDANLQSTPASAVTVEIYKDQYNDNKASVRWLVYDDRLINKAFDNADSGKYAEIEFGTYEIEDNASPFAHRWGVYNGYLIQDYDWEESSYIYDNYPALKVTENNPRRGMYCGIVSSGAYLWVDDFPASTWMRLPAALCDLHWSRYFGFYNYYGIDRDVNNINPRLFAQNGISYLICDNVSEGFKVFKTYGLKQVAEHWGDSTEIDLDSPIYHKCVSGASSYSDRATRVVISQVDNTLFFSGMKKDYVASDALDKDSLYANDVKRYIFAINNGFSLPQSFSYYYKINPIGDVSSFSFEGDAGAEVFSNTNTSETEMVLKWADTWEELYETDNEITMPLAQDVELDINRYDKVFFHYAFDTDVNSNFFRLESRKLRVRESGGGGTYYNAENDEPYAEVLVKGLRFYDTDVGVDGTTKKVAISGIVNATNKYNGKLILTDPSNVLGDNIGGAIIAPGGEVIIDFIKEIFISQISFNVSFDSSVRGTMNLATFDLSYISRFEINRYGENSISNLDWQYITSETIEQTSSTVTVTFAALNKYAKTMRLSAQSGVTLRVSDLQISSLMNPDTIITNDVTNPIINPDLIFIDDPFGLVDTSSSSKKSVAYAIFGRSKSTLSMDYGAFGVEPGYPINRISMNIYGAETTRTIAVDTWDGSTLSSGQPVWDNVFTGYVTNYEYGFVKWIPQNKNKSKNVDLKVILSDDSLLDNYSAEFKDNLTDFSDYFASNRLIGYSFKPSVYRENSLTICSSNDSSSVAGYTGVIVVNSQMDVDGPFYDDIASGDGLVERNLNIEFPLKTVRRIRIKTLNNGKNNIRINGLKIYSPIVNADGTPIWPRSVVNWDIKINAFVSY